jgi:hypothetical protein
MRILFNFTLFVLVIAISSLQAQYEINQKIEAEDLYDNRVVIGSDDPSGGGVDWMRVSHGEGWIPDPTGVDEWYPSKFIYALCGNRHWLCDGRTIIRCWDLCADVYVGAQVNIPEDGEYLIYAYVANWADSAVIENNAGCDHSSKYECSAWFVAWDDPGLLDKVMIVDSYNVPKDYLWKTYPYDVYCGQFGLDTVSLGYEKKDCPGENPRGCYFPGTRFELSAGTHTIYLKISEEYTLLDWLMVSKVGDSPPDAEPGRPWDQASSIEPSNTIKPEQFVLEQNYPNPFNPLTTISYYLPTTSNVELNVYNITSQKVANLVKTTQARGHHSVNFDGSRLPSGTYCVRIFLCAELISTRRKIPTE